MLNGTVSEVAQLSRIVSCLERAESVSMYASPLAPKGRRWRVHCSLSETQTRVVFFGRSMIDALAHCAQWIEMETRSNAASE